MNAIEVAIRQSNAKSHSYRERADQLVKSVGAAALFAESADSSSFFSRFSDNGAASRYSQFRGWLYSAIHAIGIEGASQPVQVGRLRGGKPAANQRQLSQSTKQWLMRKMPPSLQTKAALHEFEIVLEHPLVDLLEQPNPIQDRWQFAYMFITNLHLTGWAYVVGGETEAGQFEFYALPTSWVRPDKSTSVPFSRFFVGEPGSANSKAVVLGAENVKLARIPDPSHPLGGLAPITSQMNAIAIDEFIQTSQRAYYRNGLFPSVVITIGKDPHPEVPGGIRPRLSNAQRRQLMGAIKKAHAGVENYGEPAIVDGMIESITRLSAQANEMGWDSSEDKNRLRILSAFGVHPYILGEVANVGGYAQAAKIEERFCKRVNVALEMLSLVMTKFAAPLLSDSEKLSIWWEQCQASDPALRWSNLKAGRLQGDISKNEYRAELGYPPDENDEGPRSKILDNPNGMMGVLQLLSLVSQNKISAETANSILSLFLQIPLERAQQMTQDGLSGEGIPFTGPEQVPSDPPEEEPDAEGSD